MSKAIQFVKEAKEEMKKVNWPSRQQTFNYTMIIVVASLVVAIFLGGLDFAFSKLIQEFLF